MVLSHFVHASESKQRRTDLTLRLVTIPEFQTMLASRSGCTLDKSCNSTRQTHTSITSCIRSSSITFSACWNKQDNVRRTRSLSNAISNTLQDISIKYIWITLTYRITWNHNWECISIMGPSIFEKRIWPYKVTWRQRSRDHSISNRPVLFSCGGPL